MRLIGDYEIVHGCECVCLLISVWLGDELPLPIAGIRLSVNEYLEYNVLLDNI